MHLSTPYTSPKGLADDEPLSFSSDGVVRTLHRQNHGLAHVIRQSLYIPYVADFLHASPPIGYSKKEFEFTAEQLRGMQLVCLFMPVGRENEAGSRTEDSDIDRFWVTSAQHLLNFLEQHPSIDLSVYGISPDLYTHNIWYDPPANRASTMVRTRMQTMNSRCFMLVYFVCFNH